MLKPIIFKVMLELKCNKTIHPEFKYPTLNELNIDNDSIKGLYNSIIILFNPYTSSLKILKKFGESFNYNGISSTKHGFFSLNRNDKVIEDNATYIGNNMIESIKAALIGYNTLSSNNKIYCVNNISEFIDLIYSIKMLQII
jgi:hypothetical protein